MVKIEKEKIVMFTVIVIVGVGLVVWWTQIMEQGEIEREQISIEHIETCHGIHGYVIYECGVQMQKKIEELEARIAELEK
jgi:hypothetical protein